VKSAVCPSCDADIEIGAMPAYGMRLECPVCDAALKIIWLDPIELDWWDYEEDDEGEAHNMEEEEDETLFEERAYFNIIGRLDDEDLDFDMGDMGGDDFFEDKELLDK
jgi:hypothetical protein